MSPVRPALLVLTCSTLLGLASPPSATAAGRSAPKPVAAHASAAPACNDVSWLNVPAPPPFLTDVDQAAGSADCQFHEFASQNFFSLVLGNTPQFESWPTSDQVYPTSGAPICSGAPLASSLKHQIRQVPPTVAKALGAAGNLDAILQASGQPLVDQNGRYVQFEVRENPTICQAVSACQLYTKSCVTAAYAANPAFRFPSGSSTVPGVAELKLAWRVMETCNLPDSPSGCQPDDLSEFFWVGDVTVDPYSPKLPRAVTVTVGLVGFHLIQKTPNHPEFIWATWEHISNDPVCPGSDNTICRDPSKATSGVGTASGWSFLNPALQPDPGCPAINDAPNQQNPSAANCLNVSYYNPPSGSEIDPNQPRSQVCRLFPCGGGDAQDQANLAQLNQAIRAKLVGNVWWNYYLVGTLWASSPPTGDPVPPAGGLNLANTTMETFFQSNQGGVDNFNCFTCHNFSPSSQFGNLDFVHSVEFAQQAGSTTCPVDFNTCAASIGTTPQPIRGGKR
jgi:hypothetical protein